MRFLISDSARYVMHQLISVQANMRAAHVKKSVYALFGRSHNDFICAAKLDALFDL